MKLIFATNNKHKLEEMQAAIGGDVQIVSLAEAGIEVDIPEPHDSLQANATEKSRTIRLLTGEDCFSEDTGLEVDALGGEPGVRSARYAGLDKSAEQNIEKLLKKLGNESDRSARFRTVISLISGDKEYFFEGICEGTIVKKPRGQHGFGYDPVFVPTGAEKTFAEMTLTEKELYSHRKKAGDQLVNFLRQQAADF